MTTTGKAKTRFHAVTAAAAMAFLAGLSAPATSAFAHDPATHAPTHAASHHATVTQAITDAAKTAVTAPTADTGPKAAGWAGVTPSAHDLFPHGAPSGQQRLQLTDEQLSNARSIMKTGQKMNLPPRAWVVAISTAMQESKLVNLGNLGGANDHDSLGLFQQRPTSGWGTPEQITNTEHASESFYKGLTNVAGWGDMSVTEAAQAVQVSAYPDAYAQWEQQAGDIIDGFYGAGPYAAQAAHLK
jgi:hypothetical protein